MMLSWTYPRDTLCTNLPKNNNGEEEEEDNVNTLPIPLFTPHHGRAPHRTRAHALHITTRRSMERTKSMRHLAQKSQLQAHFDLADEYHMLQDKTLPQFPVLVWCRSMSTPVGSSEASELFGSQIPPLQAVGSVPPGRSGRPRSSSREGQEGDESGGA